MNLQIKLFDIKVNGESLPVNAFPTELEDFRVPIIAEGKFGDLDFDSLCKGMETVSGKQLHIREGIVVRPEVMRKDKRGNVNLFVKVINPKYAKKETGEEIS